MKLLYLVVTACLLRSATSDDVGVRENPFSDNYYINRRHARFERATSAGKAGFTFDEHVKIVRKHNELRRTVDPTATLMNEIFWDPKLEKYAQDYANKCKYVHNPNRVQVPGLEAYFAIGENMWAGTGSYTGEGIVQNWFSEVKDFTYADNKCADGKACGHYTQVIWANTKAVGCGIKFCPTIEGLSYKNGHLVVCNYGPNGNVNNHKPYEAGTNCSKCASPLVCEKDLCRPANCGGLACKNSGVLLNDVCECNCTATAYNGITCSELKPVDGGNGNGTNTGGGGGGGGSGGGGGGGSGNAVRPHPIMTVSIISIFIILTNWR